MVSLRMNDTQNETASPKARSSEQARAAVQARWVKAKGIAKDPQGSTAEGMVEPVASIEEGAGVLGVDRDGRAITNHGLANIQKNIWAYVWPYCPDLEVV
jgi:hypothetical protein